MIGPSQPPPPPVSLSLSLCLPFSLPLSPPLCPSLPLSACLTVCLFLCLSLCLRLSFIPTPDARCNHCQCSAENPRALSQDHPWIYSFRQHVATLRRRPVSPPNPTVAKPSCLLLFLSLSLSRAAVQHLPVEQQRVRVPGVREVLPGQGPQHARLHPQRAERAPRLHQPADVPGVLPPGLVRGGGLVPGGHQEGARPEIFSGVHRRPRQGDRSIRSKQGGRRIIVATLAVFFSSSKTTIV